MIQRTFNKSGAVLLTVIILTIVLSVIVIGIMSVTVSQVKSSQAVIDELKAEYLAQGYFYRYHQGKVSNTPISLDQVSGIMLDSKPFSVDFDEGDGSGTFGTNSMLIDISYP